MTENMKKQIEASQHVFDNEEKFIKPPTFSFICFATVFFFLFYALSIILFIGLFPIISDLVMNLISGVNGYQVCALSIFMSIITVFYFTIQDIRKNHEQLKKLGIMS